MLQAGVRDQRVPQVEPFEAGEGGDVPHGVVVGFGVAQVQFFRPLAPAISASPAPVIGVSRRASCFKPVSPFMA